MPDQDSKPQGPKARRAGLQTPKAAPAIPADLTLSDGRPVVLDLSKITIAEYRRMFDKGQPQEEEDELLARVAGLALADLLALPQPDYRRLTRAFLKKAAEPLADPN